MLNFKVMSAGDNRLVICTYKELLKRVAEERKYRCMKSTNALDGVFFFFFGWAFLVPGCASHPVATEEANNPADKIDVQALFRENCSTCHGKNGRANTFHGWLAGAQNLTKPKWQEETTDSEILDAIKTGPSVMPAFEKKLSEAEIEALARYVRTLKQSD